MGCPVDGCGLIHASTCMNAFQRSAKVTIGSFPLLQQHINMKYYIIYYEIQYEIFCDEMMVDFNKRLLRENVTSVVFV